MIRPTGSYRVLFYDSGEWQVELTDQQPCPTHATKERAVPSAGHVECWIVEMGTGTDIPCLLPGAEDRARPVAARTWSWWVLLGATPIRSWRVHVE